MTLDERSPIEEHRAETRRMMAEQEAEDRRVQHEEWLVREATESEAAEEAKWPGVWRQQPGWMADQSWDGTT